MKTLRKRKYAFCWDYLCIIVGTAISSFGIYNIHSQSDVTEGGVIGLVLLFSHWFKVSPAISTFLLDAACYILAFKLLGKRFLKRSIVATFLMSFYYFLYDALGGPILPSFENNKWVASILGGLCVGVGVGLVVRVKAAAGGDDALALAISDKLKWPISKAYLFTDVVVLVLSLSYISLRNIFFSLITVTFSSFIIGFVENVGKSPAKELLTEKEKTLNHKGNTAIKASAKLTEVVIQEIEHSANQEKKAKQIQ